MITRSKPLFIAGLCALLIACGSNKTADIPAKELYNNAMEYTIAKDAKYDFSMSGTLSGLDDPMLQSLRFNVTGAADNAASKYELQPDISLPIMQLKLPLLLDIKKEELLIDASTLIPMAGMVDPNLYAALSKYENKITRFKLAQLGLPAEVMERKDAAFELVSIFMQSSIEASKSIPDVQFKKLADNEKGKTLKAASVVELNLNAEQSLAMNKNMEKLIIAKIKASSKFKEEDKEQLLESLSQAFEENDDETYALHTILYLNDDQKPIHQEAKYSFGMPTGETAHANLVIDYSNFGKPTFTLGSAAGIEVIDFDLSDIMPLMMMAQ